MPLRPRAKPQRVALPDWPLADLPGLSVDDRALMHQHGITTLRQLRQQTATATDRALLASRLEIHCQHVNKWAALADLAQVPSVGCRYCGLLLHAGIASPVQLAQIPFPRLHRQIVRLQVGMMQRADLCPSLEEVKQWVEQAQQLCRAKNVQTQGITPKAAQNRKRPTRAGLG